MYNMIKL